MGITFLRGQNMAMAICSFLTMLCSSALKARVELG